MLIRTERWLMIAWGLMGMMAPNALAHTTVDKTSADTYHLGQAGEVFSLSSVCEKTTVLPLRLKAQKGHTLLPFTSARSVTGVAVSGKIVRHDPDYIVRILLKDREGRKHLVLESYEEINDADTILLDNYAEETLLLDNVAPDSLEIIAEGATVELDNIHYTAENASRKALQRLNVTTTEQLRDTLRRQQVQHIVDRINSYNRAHKKLWRAGVTGVSLKPYNERYKVIGAQENVLFSKGLEYYAGGIFEYGEINNRYLLQANSSPYIKEFDWRNRHGKNWMTSVKSQIGSMFCVPFGTLGALEAVTNLYYNDTINLDLSEQQVAMCQTDVPLQYAYDEGMFPETALKFIKNNGGVYDEEAYPYVPGNQHPVLACRSDSVTPNEIVSLTDYHRVTLHEDSIKKYLIQKGPLVGKYPGHMMALAGFGVLQVGDTIAVIRNHIHEVAPDTIVIREGDSRIGKTFWKFKNSAGLQPYPNWNEHNQGYLYILYNNISYMEDCFYIETPIHTLNRTEDNILCEDRDGDGYYNWGIGPRPAHCPANAPDEADGDDSNPLYGPMDEYGNLADLHPDSCDVIHITPNMIIVKDAANIITDTLSNTEFNELISLPLHQHIIVDTGATWTISGKQLTFINGATVTIKAGAKLRLMGMLASLIDADIHVHTNGTLDIQSGATIQWRNANSQHFHPALKNFDLYYGKILSN